MEPVFRLSISQSTSFFITYFHGSLAGALSIVGEAAKMSRRTLSACVEMISALSAEKMFY